MRNNKKYSAAEKRAYYRGQGYAACKAGKKVAGTGDKVKASFISGLKSGKGVKK